MRPRPKTWSERFSDLAFYLEGNKGLSPTEAILSISKDIGEKIGLDSNTVHDWFSQRLPKPPQPYTESAEEALQQAESVIDKVFEQLSMAAQNYFEGQTIPKEAELIEGLANGKLVGATIVFKEKCALLLAPPRTRIVGICFLFDNKPPQNEIEKIALSITSATSWSSWSKIGAVI